MTSGPHDRLVLVDGHGIGTLLSLSLEASRLAPVFAGVDLVARDAAELEILTLEERLAGIKSKLAADRAKAEAGVPVNRAQRRKAASQARRRK